MVVFLQRVQWLFINHSLPITFKEKKYLSSTKQDLWQLFVSSGVCNVKGREGADRSVGSGFVLGFSPVGSGSPRHGRMDRQQLVLPGLFTINQSAKTLNMYFANLVNSLSSIYILKWKCVGSVAGSNARVEKQTNNGFRECKVNC